MLKFPTHKYFSAISLGCILGIMAGATVCVMAATFDSDILPASGSSIRIGTQPGDISSINNTIFFSGSNVGIGSSAFSPTQRLQIDGGGLRFTNPPAQPTCDATTRGTIWFKQPGGASADIVQACLLSGGSIYAWTNL